ncbi:Adenylate cyclase type 10 [Phlyctochytrium bullatum]|nr:Adenylate cyclase type 10 [Phlyctochytrium bullatum]
MAFAEESFLAVVMIDISGYSKLTSELSTLGKLASEVITKSLGQYLDKVDGRPIFLPQAHQSRSHRPYNKKVIHVVGQFNGDVIKFLGDALLISFEADPETYNQSDSQANVVLTALHFLVTVMTSLPTAVFDLNSFSDAALALGSSTENTRVLRLHSAVWCGRATHVIAGLAGERLDYFIAGEFAGAIEAALNLAKRDEIGLSPMVAAVVEEALGMNLNRAKSSEYVTLDSRDISTLYHLLGKRRGNFSSSCVDFTQFPSTTVRVSYHTEEQWQRDVETFRLFINDAMVYKIKSVAGNFEAAQQQTADISTGVNVGDYRTVVVVFVKLVDAAFTLDAVQEALVAFLHSVRRFLGVFQQVAVDDKGTTLLAAFGLPPFTQEANALNAIHSLMAFGEMSEESKFGNFVAGVSSGDLLFTRIGNNYKSEASFVGDAICTAARLMTFSTQKNVVVFDNSIKPFLPTRYPVESLGGVKLKGKSSELDLFQIRLSGRDATIKSAHFVGGSPYVSLASAGKANYVEGYKHEKEKLTETIDTWVEWYKSNGTESQRPSVACTILGPMGSGKSAFIESTLSSLRERKAEVW